MTRETGRVIDALHYDPDPINLRCFRIIDKEARAGIIIAAIYGVKKQLRIYFMQTLLNTLFGAVLELHMTYF